MTTQVVVNDDDVLATVPEIFCHGCSRIWRKVALCEGVENIGEDDDGVFHRSRLVEFSEQAFDIDFAFADQDIDDNTVGAFLVSTELREKGTFT